MNIRVELLELQENASLLDRAEFAAIFMTIADEYHHLQLLQQKTCTTQLPTTYAVTRVEVIDEAGRSYVNWHYKNSVEVQFQDESRTMKVFISRTQNKKL